jgi:preprotein translocase subunit SecD
MIIGRNRFNINLLLLFVALAVGGCQTGGTDREKQLATMRIHIEVAPSAFSSTASVYREKPVEVTVDKTPFLTEAHVVDAKLVEAQGGFDLELKLSRKGTWLLESYTTANVGKHMAIFCQFGEKKFRDGRWLGAPVIEKRVSNGTLKFVPDVTRDEAGDIVIGLKNSAKEHEEDARW